MSKRAKKFASKHYANLFKYPERSPFWIFRKYSAQKGAEFTHSTGEKSNEAKAYGIGMRAFNEWLGKTATTELLGPFAQSLLNLKLKLPDDKFSPNSKRASSRDFGYIIEHFGHLRLDQMTSSRWEEHYTEALSEKSQTFFNRRKALIEIMIRARRDGLIDQTPEYENPDSEPEEGEYLEDEWVKLVLTHSHADDQSLLYDLLWKQGPRPGEALQYEWSMIKWKEGDHGYIHIPGRITKTRRPRNIPLNAFISQRLKDRQKTSKSCFIFPGRDNPDTHQVEYKTGWNGAKRRAMEDIDKELGLKPNYPPEQIAHLREGRKKIAASSIYALRGTFITNCLDAGLSSTLIGKYCDTSSVMIDRRYARRKKSSMQAIAAVGGGSS